MASDLRFAAEYALLRTAVGALGRLPFSVAGTLGARLGALGYSPLGIRRGVVERQVAAAFPDWAPAEVDRVARAAYEHLGRVSVEAAILPRRGRERVLELFEGEDGTEVLDAALARGRGVLLVSGHLGNWELGGAYVAARGVPVAAVARHMANPRVDGYITRTRERLGMRVVHDERAVREVPRVVRQGGAVAMLVDQGALGLASMWVPFFGRPAKTPRGPATFALRLDAPVVFAAAVRQPSGRYRIGFEAVAAERSGDREADIARIVEAYTATLERWVRRYPEQYFWHHRRWKHQPPGTPADLGEP